MSTTLQRTAARQLSQHRRLIRSGRGGRVLSALMLPMLWLLRPHGYGVLTTTGRRTGRPRRKCVRVVPDTQKPGTFYLVALRPPEVTAGDPGWLNAWVHNIRAHPSVQLRCRGSIGTGTAREITGTAELAHARRVLTTPVFALDYGECALHLHGPVSRTKIRQLHRYWFTTGTPVTITTTEAPQ